MPRRADYDTTMDEQVEDLRERMRLLQGDRKANIDMLEASKQTNKDLIRRLRKENKDLRTGVASLRRGEDLNSGKGDGEEQEILQLNLQISKHRKLFDDLKHKNQGDRGSLETLKDEVKSLQLEARRPNLEDSPQTRKIRMLENRLDKAMIKYNEAQSIRKTYEQIVKRLKEERIGFDNQLAAIERTLEAKNHDHEELMLLSSDANHAKDMVLQELERVRGNYEEENRLRQKEKLAREQIVKVKVEMNNRLLKREKAKQDVATKDLTEEEEKSLKTSVAVNHMQQGKVVEEKKEHRSKIDVFENAFRKIKEATGVSDVNEVIQKIVSQEGTTENLMLLTRENQTRIEALTAECEQLKVHVEELKFSGSGAGHRRKMVDDHEENLALATTKLERSRLKYERLAKILISVKAGIEHLTDKIESVREDRPIIRITDDTIVDVLHQSEQTLIGLLQSVKSSHAPTSDEFGDSEARINAANASILAASSLNINDMEIMQSRPHNQRIPLPGENNAVDEQEGQDHGLEDNDEALSREKVKRASCQVIEQQDKKKKRNPRKKGGKDDHGDDSIEVVVAHSPDSKRRSPKKRK